MGHTGYEIIWIFFCYSFAGWLLETIAAGVKQRRFVNRGVVNMPFCVLYGLTAVIITVFGRELQGVWLFIGSAVVATILEWMAGHLIERIYHEKWWDYSNIKWNLDGYICLPASILWGILALVMMRWGNRLLFWLFGMIPYVLRLILIYGLLAVLTIDVLATVIAAFGRGRNLDRWKTVDQWFTRNTMRLAQKLDQLVNARIRKAYPESQKTEKTKTVSGIFAYGCSFYKLVWLFVIGAFLGDVVETIFCRITAGVWMSRSSVVWGPFSVVWGLGLAIATLLLHRYRNRSDGMLFLIGTVVGGVYEYVCSVFTEIVFGKVFWDYSHMQLNLGGRINLLYCFFWGIAAVVWMKMLYPKVSAWIEKVPVKPGKVISWVVIIFMCCNMAVSCMALIRSEQRQNGILAEYGWQRIMDERFDDERLEKIYPNAIDARYPQ